ncbi:sigma-54 interaction domain-containing protein [Jeongeupia naejangsanensis]|uniref:Sigma 54-interacting transcriptional regulator n=1 Tax=Jeongeupia naejangsanensis TaxID=613195 RepID=A0ABS2BS62_9NEIS|nr:sigma 54-interacting transcriptional regulator [Jeongeupia naejangsanensis]MBM3117878.1 sigma 54-interacting transcriptional regulator [Jeongeupia naejangsanensis]
MSDLPPASALGAHLADYEQTRDWAIASLFRSFETFSEGTVIVDADTRVVWINARYADRFGFKNPADALGRPVEEVIPSSLLREVVRTGKPMLLDLMPTRGGSLVVTRLPLRDEAGLIVGAIGFALYDEVRSLSPLIAKVGRLNDELAAARESLAQARRAKYSFDNFVGSAPASEEVKRQAQRAATMDSPVLLLGETGTGKEVLAHAIHSASRRASKPLVTLNMAAIPESLLEAELFGAAAGAYTGADRKGRVGKFQLADGGTLFLDEIGDLPLALQAKLLRVLQDKEFEALGSNQVIRSDVRIIAATSARLLQQVETGAFRADLFYRLNVLSIQLPPLRERSSDIAALCATVFAELAATEGGAVRRIDAGGIALLQGYDWPGNVRELRNVLERATMLSDHPVLGAAELLPLLRPGLPSPQRATAPNYTDAMASFEKQLLEDALAACNGRVIDAAARLGIGRATFYKKMVLHGLRVSANQEGRPLQGA